MVGMTRSASLMGASGTKQTPSVKSSSRLVPTSSPRRVLPTPPVPVSVTRRTSGCRRRAHTAATSCSRPTSGVSCAGRLWNRTFNCPTRSAIYAPPVGSGLAKFTNAPIQNESSRQKEATLKGDVDAHKSSAVSLTILSCEQNFNSANCLAES